MGGVGGVAVDRTREFCWAGVPLRPPPILAIPAFYTLPLPRTAYNRRRTTNVQFTIQQTEPSGQRFISPDRYGEGLELESTAGGPGACNTPARTGEAVEPQPFAE